MLVVMQAGATEAQIQAVIDRLVGRGFNVHRSTGVVHTVLGGVGPMDDFDPADFEVMEGVKECHRIMSPYKLASRHFRPGGTGARWRSAARVWSSWPAPAAWRAAARSSARRNRWRQPAPR